MPELTEPAIPAGRIAASAQPVVSVDPGLSLRPWSVSDAQAVIAAYTDPDIRYWHARSVVSEVEARALIERWRSGWAAESSAEWAIVRAGDDASGGVGRGSGDGVPGDAVLGRIALRAIDTGRGKAEIAYWVRPEARGGGVAGRALVAVTAWAFDEVGFHRLFLVHSMANEASCRVATKAGFAAEGVERSSLLHADGWHDMHVHARIAGAD